MSVNSHLINLSSALVLRGTEKDSINTSISTLSSRLTGHFGANISQQFRFGSSVRETILPRKADENSDIDYMIVFNTSSGTYKPQTYLDQLRRFAERNYSSSEIHQSHPTVTLELNHIQFDLVPAIYNYSQYQIPSPASTWSDWMPTDPNGFSQRLTTANTNYNSQVKPLVRLVKYWNALNGYCFASFDLENYIVGVSFWGCNYLRDFFYTFWNGFSCSYDSPQYVKDKVQRAKERALLIRQYEQQGNEGVAENELQRFIPAIS